MNKSTPISQLSGGNTPANMFITEQQKNMVANQQAAVGTMSLPQNTHGNDMLAEDESTIQEVLNSINASQTMQPPSNQLPPQQQPQYQPATQNTIPQSQATMDQIDALMMQNMNMMHSNNFGMPSVPIANFQNSSSSVEMFVSLFADDIKLAVMVGVVFIAVNFVPITSFLGKYVNIEKIPYHDIILKSVLAAVVVVAIKKFMQNGK
jgi:hypothetical protein